MPATDDLLPPLPEFAAPGRVAPSLRGRVQWQHAEVVAVRRETPGLRTVRLALPVWNEHVAGQHYMVRLTAADGYTTQRHYSVASPPGDTGHIDLTVDRVEGGEVSGYFHTVARPGDRIEVRGPLGGFFAWSGDRPALLVGGGSGVVPLVSMLRHARSVPGTADLHLVACVRTPEDLPYASELASAPDVTVVHSRRAPTGQPVGRLTAETLAPHAAQALAEDREVFVCGSTSFAESVAKPLLTAGLPPTHLRIERFG
ncbi:ferredoxin reductase [Yinghuangia soli]|uniref:Ferredoxin reductase n=1 Tax=Yinghuangia soli TaxID=2908204 RepID=A0AA41U014_9ACTN|nr:ferredoxin reductase [Yinghuangia soli]MCF2527895.1 ferredoxin reductase [Yinghuangia soli]